MDTNQIRPHGLDHLVKLLADPDKKAILKDESPYLLSWDLTPYQLCDIELLINGAFTPLEGFMNRKDYETVLDHSCLENGLLWPIPITLDVNESLANQLGLASKLALRDPEGSLVAVLHVEDVWQPNRLEEAETVFQTTDTQHPGVHKLLNKTNSWYVGGKIEALELPSHFDFMLLRHSPAQLRDYFAKTNQNKVVAFQTRNPMHRAHRELTSRAANNLEADLLIHPVVGFTKHGDISHFTRVKCYQALLSEYPKVKNVTLSLLPLSMRMAGPKEAVWHAIIRKNYGCSHFIIGRDHASPGKDSMGKDYYDPYEAHELLNKYEKELEIKMVLFKELIYIEKEKKFVPFDNVPSGQKGLSLSGSKLRELLREGKEVPEWYTYPEVLDELRRIYPPKSKQGFTILFTGLSGAGKSTLARALYIKLLEKGGRPVSLLDGDIVRKHLSSELGFSKAHRNLNVLRIGFVASEITKNGGIALCAPIAPYEDIREEVQEMIEEVGGFILVYVSTSLEVCEKRDRKGLYAKARAGILKQFTGISDPYEPPKEPHITIDTVDITPEEGVNKILNYIESEGFQLSW